MGDESTIFTIKWGDEINHLSQQKKSFLEDKVLVKTGVVGERTTMEQLGPKTLQRVTGRNTPQTPTDPDLRRRWITMFDYDDATLFNKFDEMKSLLDPRNPFNESLVMGANRTKDELIIDAFSATAYTGKAGTTTQAITYTIANGSTGLTLDKLRQVNRRFQINNVDPMEPKYMVISPKDHEDLLKIAEVISRDYNGEKPVLVDGVVKRFMGLDFVVLQMLEDRTLSAGVTKCFAWAKTGMGLALAMEPKLKVSQRDDLKGLPWQAYCAISGGSSRLEEAKVIEVDTYHA